MMQTLHERITVNVLSSWHNRDRDSWEERLKKKYGAHQEAHCNK
jgi:hypothetical protein